MRPLLLALALSSWMVATSASAQRALELQLFRPPPGPVLSLSLPDPRPSHHLAQHFSLVASHARHVLRQHEDCAMSAEPCLVGAGGGAADVVTDLAQLELGYAIGLFEALELGAVVPVAYARSADDLRSPTRLRGHAGLADARLSAQLALLRGDLELAFTLVASLPTGDQGQLLGAPRWGAGPGLVAALSAGTVRLGLAAAYRVRPREHVLGLEQDDELDIRLGAEIPLADGVDVLAEAQLAVGVGGETVLVNEVPLELRGGARLALSEAWALDLGLGAAVPPGDDGAGAPAGRVLGALRYQTRVHGCENGPEDFDGFQDGDYCADLDDDGDGLPDTDDACPSLAEDRDGFADDDGCPDPDNDVDGLPDDADACPDSSEDSDGYQDADGCPDLDNDADGLVDGRDRCAMDPEDADGFEDDDGCPEPGPAPPSVTVTEGRILLSERIYFEFDRDQIRAVSNPLLDRLAAVIGSLPGGRIVRVIGHTDDSGNPAYNHDLSYRRARAVVEALVERGVPRARLAYEGRGAREPLTPNDSPEGRAMNRRVELFLGPGPTP